METEAGVLRCPSCGAPCSPDARACPHCDAELASVRCPHCFALHFTGSRFCARCGRELSPEPLLELVEASCPRCSRSLRMAAGAPDESEGRVYECTGCGGLFVDRVELDRIIAREASERHARGADDSSSGLDSVGRRFVPVAHAPDVVHYVKCPRCQGLMNRVNFGRRSGIVVDVCKEHGTWFDAGELTAAIEFVASGGYAESKRREAEEREREKAALVAALAPDAATLPHAPGWPLPGGPDSHVGDHRYTRWVDLLLELLR